jgi:hypothetical protein
VFFRVDKKSAFGNKLNFQIFFTIKRRIVMSDEWTRHLPRKSSGGIWKSDIAFTEPELVEKSAPPEATISDLTRRTPATISGVTPKYPD